MVSLIKDIDFSDVEEGFPALLGLILMPLTFSITVGIGAAFVAHVFIKVVRGKISEIHPLLWVVAIAFVVYFGQAWINSDPAEVASPRLTSPRPPRRLRPRRGAAATSCTIGRMFERTALPAGPRVISARLPAARSVSIAAYVLAGSRLETAGQVGVAHFMEHLTFKGTEAYPSTRAISEAIEGVGGSFNAATDRESTVYWVRVPRREVDARDGRRRRADRPAAPRRTPTSRASATVIIEEIRSYLDDPSEYCQILFQTAMFGDGPLGREICGEEADILAPPRGGHPRLLAERLPAGEHGRRGRRRPVPRRGDGPRRDRVRDRQRRDPRVRAGPDAARPARASAPASATRARRSSASASRRSIATIPTAGRWPSSTRSSATG